MFLNLQSNEMLFYGQVQSQSIDFQTSVCNQYIITLLQKDVWEKEGKKMNFSWTLKCGDRRNSSFAHRSGLVTAYTLICLFKGNYLPLVNDEVLDKTQKELKKLSKFLEKSN